MKKMTTVEFVNKSKIVHGNRYDYSLVDYNGRDSFVIIKCPIHGDFLQKPHNHLNGCGCPKCFGTPKLTTEEFIKKCIDKYGDKYNYDKVVYTGNKNKVIIKCPIHGEWSVTPNNFLRGSECPKCYGTPKYTIEQFVELAKKKHFNKYNYSKTIYSGNKNNIIITCPIHGDFSQRAGSHLRGSGCPECTGLFYDGKRIKFDHNMFIKQSKINHSIAYDYSKVHFEKPTDKVSIVCPKHGEFIQGAYYHSRGGNCPKCVGGKKLDGEYFIEKAKKVHGDKYDYSIINYKNYSTKVCIICKEHGEFWQTPNSHLFGAGCPSCPQSNLEGEMRQFLLNHSIRFEQEKSFDWLKLNKRLYLDFYLPDYNIAIECQGLQHFKPIDLFGGEDFFKKTLERDSKKYNLCKKNGIEVIYFTNVLESTPYNVINNFTELLDIINKKNNI